MIIEQCTVVDCVVPVCQAASHNLFGELQCCSMLELVDDVLRGFVEEVNTQQEENQKQNEL